MWLKEEIRALPSTPRDLRKFGWTMGVALAVLWAIFAYGVPAFGGEGADVSALWIAGLLLAAVGTVAPIVLKPLYYAWMTFAVLLGWLMTRVLLTVFFCLILIPVGLVMRLAGRDVLKRKLEPDAETYWIDKEYLIADRSRFEKFF